MSKLLERREGPALFLVNNNPDARNALSLEYSRGLVEALNRAGSDRSVAAVILTGAEGFFCAGGDLNILKTRREMAVEERVASIEILHDAIRAIRDCPKPVIAAVEGGAAGAGASLALAADLVVAADDAYFAVSYLRVGLTPDGGSTSFLSQLAPRQLVNEILMLGDKMPVARLHALGAINLLCAPGSADDAARGLAERLYKMGPEALASVKRLVWQAQNNDLQTQLDIESRAMAQAQGGEESGEGIAAFLEKRKPDFSKFR